MSYAVGSLVRARGREWVVLPETDDDLVMVRPLGGTDAEVTGILTAVEEVAPATFAPPELTDLGDHRSARMLRDALRLGIRSSAGPFRSFGDIAVEPRPYQLVPLMMALKLDPVRLLIADDVGVGKTVEAGLIAKELLTTGQANGLAVLCPPHLAEQWQRELAEKFHLDAVLVLASTAARLERDLPVGRSIFEHHPITIVSLDFIKADRHRDDFLRACPNLVIVDEAHTCADPAEGRGSRHQRHQLLAGLAADPERHVVLVTATPHSGKVTAFRSLLALLDPSFESLGDDISERELRSLARHLVQRRRGDIVRFLGDTPFPERTRIEESYALSPRYAELFDDVLAFARETVSGPDSDVRQRVRWWSALALLRAMASSPAAAEATLRTRAANAEAEDVGEVDAIGRLALFDDDADSETEQSDTSPGGDSRSAASDDTEMGAALRAFAERAAELRGKDDTKAVKTLKRVKGLLADGFQPIVFCRFIDTARYLATELRAGLPKGVAVEAVTGLLPPSEREDRVRALGGSEKRVLVATDCLSEGINLQQWFTAIVHYDLPWNPTRLEQREGRVDRFGQTASEVRVATIVGDHAVDRIVQEVLIEKHLKIRRALGVSVPVPATSGEVLEALADRLFSVDSVRDDVEQLRLPDVVEQFEAEWESDAERERVSRSRFAQHGIKPEEVLPELEATQAALGDAHSVDRFVADAVQAHHGVVAPSGAGRLRVDTSEVTMALADRLAPAAPEQFTAVFEPPTPEGTIELGRTHPFVAALAGYVIDTSLDPKLDSVASRAGVIRTDAVERRTTVVVARFRFRLVTYRNNRPTDPLLAEDAAVLAFRGDPAEPEWLEGDLDALIDSAATSNVSRDLAEEFFGDVRDSFSRWSEHLGAEAQRRSEALAESHRRVRKEVDLAGRVEVTPSLPVDVLGVYVLLPELAR